MKNGDIKMKLKRFLLRHRGIVMAGFSLVMAAAMIVSFLMIDNRFEVTVGSNAAASVDFDSSSVEIVENSSKKITLTAIITVESEIEKSTSTVSVGELEDKLEIEHFDDEDEEEEKLNIDKTMTDSTLEHDLFNLIDSMYDDKEE